ncbi:MAG: hypothetical protein M1829_006401 [Trizodia sp. TS-e1964]|nr:MAG: hypothetical protein M1829_006401 [Trizodia sp. TS-e1964]
MESHLNTIFPVNQQNHPRFEHPVPSSYATEPRVLQDTTGNRQDVLDLLEPDFAKTPLEDRLAAFSNKPVDSNSLATDMSRTSKRRRVPRSNSAVPAFTEEQSVAYRNYRAKIRRIKGSSNAVWPDALEEVFQEGMKLVTPAKNPSSRLDEFHHFSQNMLLAEPNRNILESDRSGPYLSLDQSDEFAINNASGYFVGNSREKSVRPIGFDMWLQPFNQTSNQSPHSSPHVYTSLSENPSLPPQPLESLGDWRSKFPDLLNLHPNGAVNSEIVLLECTINLMKSYPPEGSRLGVQIEVVCDNQELTPYRWGCKTSIYSMGKRVYQKSKEVSHETKNGTVFMSPAFGSNFWAHQFINLVERVLRSQEDPLTLQQEEIRSRNIIKGLSAVQELIAIPKHPHTGSKRVAIFLWAFSATQYGERGCTTWRNIIPPPVSILPNSSNSIERYAPPAPLHENPWTSDSGMSVAPQYREQPEVPSNATTHAPSTPLYPEFAWNFQDAPMDSSLASSGFDIHYDMPQASTEFPEFNHLETTTEESQNYSAVRWSEFTPSIVDHFYPQ